MNRKSTGWTSEVTARSRSLRNLISSRRQTMLTARRSARMLRSGTATLMSSVRSRSRASETSSGGHVLRRHRYLLPNRVAIRRLRSPIEASASRIVLPV